MNRGTSSALAEMVEESATQPGHDMEAGLPVRVGPRRWIVPVGRVVVLLVIIALWQLTAGNLIDKFYLPKPADVLFELKDWLADGSLLGHVLATLIPAVEGFIIATVAALLLGYGLAMARSAAGVLEPYITALYGIPIIALVPLLIVWVGIGDQLAVAIATLGSVSV